MKKIVRKIKEKLCGLDNERLAIVIVSLVGFSLLLPLVIIEPGILESEWFLGLIRIPAEYGGFIADGAYIGRLVNLLTAQSFETKEQEKTKVRTLFNKEVVMGRQILIREKELTPIGMLLGAFLAIICISLHVAIASFFSFFSYILFILAYACSLGGLFNRLGSSIDGTRLSQEKKAILLGAVLGFIFALSLIVVLATTGSLPFIAVAGITKVFFDLFVLHKTLFTLMFVLSLTSLMTSFFDYVTKALCFLKYCFGKDKEVNARIESRYHEYRGAFLGTVVGCLIAVIIVSLMVGSLFTAPIASVVITSFIIFITCSSVISALFSRIGRVIDGINRVSTLVEKKQKNNQAATLTSEQTNNLKNNDVHCLNTIAVKDNNTLQQTPQCSSPKPDCIIKVHAKNEQVGSVCKPELPKKTYSHRVMFAHLGSQEAIKLFCESNSLYRKDGAAFFKTDEKDEEEESCFYRVSPIHTVASGY